MQYNEANDDGDVNWATPLLPVHVVQDEPESDEDIYISSGEDDDDVVIVTLGPIAAVPDVPVVPAAARADVASDNSEDARMKVMVAMHGKLLRVLNDEEKTEAFNAGSRGELPSWAKIAICHDDSLEMRQKAAI